MSDHLLSVILLVPPASAERIPAFVADATRAMPADYPQYELIVLQDGGTPLTSDVTQDLLIRYAGVRYVCLSQSRGLERAISVGLSSAIGDVCVVMVPGVDPFDLIGEFARTCDRSRALVIGQRANPRDEAGLTFRLIKRVFHFVAYRLLDFNFPKNTTFMMGLNRELLNLISQAGDRVRFFRAITSYIGLPIVTIPYQVRGPLRSFWDSVNLSIEILIMNSTRPLRLMGVLSLALSLSNLAYVGYVVAIYAFKPGVAAGWTTISLQLSLGLFILFIILAVFSEYLYRVLAEVRDRPDFVTLFDVRSQQPIFNADLRNVTHRL